MNWDEALKWESRDNRMLKIKILHNEPSPYINTYVAEDQHGDRYIVNAETRQIIHRMLGYENPRPYTITVSGLKSQYWQTYEPSTIVVPEPKKESIKELQERTARHVLDRFKFVYALEWIDESLIVVVTDLVFDSLMHHQQSLLNYDAGTIHFCGYLMVTEQVYKNMLDQRQVNLRAVTGATTRLGHNCPPSPEEAKNCIYCGIPLI